MKIFDTIRQQADLKRAEAIRSGSGVNLRDECAAASMKAMEGFGDAQLDAFVDVFLTKAAGYSITQCGGLVPELVSKDEDAASVQKAVIEACVMSGQYFKATIKGSVRGILGQMHVRVADTVASIATEAVISNLGGGSKQLKEGGD